MHSQRGVALIAVLWVLTLLAVVAAAVTVDARTEMMLARNLFYAAEAEALADAAVLRAVLSLVDRRGRRGDDEPDEAEDDDGDSLAAFIERRPALEDAIVRRMGADVVMDAVPIPEGDWPVDGSPVRFTLDGALVMVSIQDTGGLIDLNTAADALLEGLFTAAGLSSEEAGALVAAVGDWTDEDDLVSEGGGAEAPAYRAAGLPAPRNGQFRIPEELMHVLGVTRALFAALRPAITVWSGRPGIDPRVAPEAVLWTLPGGNTAQINALLTDRAGGIVGTPGLIGLDALTSLSRGTTFAIRAAADTGDAVFVREAVIRIARRRGRGYEVLDWRRGKAAAVGSPE